MVRNIPNGLTPVDSITYDEKRTNLPTADAIDFLDSPVLEEIRQVRYARDESLDPQLVWRGKYPSADDLDEYDADLVTDAPPIFIQEKIDPRVLIENLRRSASRLDDEPELTLFDSFDGLDDLQQIEFYEHDANWSNRMILGDSLQVMASLAEREKLRGKVQMVYIDPPYGIKFGSNWQVRTRERSVADGNILDAAREAEVIKAFRDTWELGIHSYLTYLRDRLTVSQELLTPSGSCFVQIGAENVHRVRALMDEVFGPENFVSQISVRKTATPSGTLDDALFYIIWYAKSIEDLKYRQLWRMRDAKDWFSNTPGGSWGIELNGERRPTTAAEKSNPDLIPSGARIYALSKLNSAGASKQPQDFEFRGQVFHPGARNHWKTSVDGLRKLDLANRLESRGGPPWFVRFHDDHPNVPVTNLFEDTAGKSSEALYVVQTQPDVIQRCVLMTTDPGDLVLDPTCGSGTTAFVAETWGRRWVTIDTSRVALALARQRVMGARYPWYLLSDSSEGNLKEQQLSAAVLPRSGFGSDIRHGFVYDRVPHITLKSIANNPDIKKGMSNKEIDDAIKRHADFELLYDKPFEDSKKVRVAGPFTVESLSPHRALSFKDWEEPVSETEAAKDSDSPNFEQSILENLAKAGIQNGTKAERMKFAAFESYAGSYIQAVGEQSVSDGQSKPPRIAIAIGPQYGTVSSSYVKNAAKEAIRADGVDLLCILGFAFDPNVTNVTDYDGVTVEATHEGFATVEGARLLGKLPVLMVRMNSDLLMGEELKKTGAGNLFTVFGEPDI
ncbi:adenine-specific DNA-methyltransferase [Pseudarthrobacter oxydans]|uniref:Adenine-specific DNA-methyltransferase n=1 Tax=Pseudarthrobacter oxydans TaxID=1671 RepID=A0AAW8NGK8_PSEOX|nr:site-specific DNA-methyltransferase [Pseudarthrobacter oxydans]MDR6794794.1 adenine-specific DNA-methyltransferase [Pseudarthrobacter oxydans]MDR7166221.1 adenine-specific DNA-methyltransferase [Pseudarthrobacter oxydans]